MKASRPPERLPEYERPPVVEVALAIEFDEPVGFRSLNLGLIAAGWSDWLPLAEERPPLPRMGPPTEDLLDDLVDSLFGLDSSALEEPPRLWLQNEVGDQVVQIQRDRLVVNWRKEGASSYPRYRFVRAMLQDSWDRLTGLCGGLGYETPTPDLCEMQYINHIGNEQGWISSQDTARLIVPWHGVEDNEFLPAEHLCRFSMHCHFLADREGWLDIDGWTTSVVDDDGDLDSERLVLNLTSRGHALLNDFESALAFFDVAHVWIVRGFTAVTSPLAHETWGRTQ